VGRADAWFGAAAIAGVAIAAGFDQQVTDQVPLELSEGEQHFNDLVRPFGSPALLAPALVAAWGAGKLWDNPALSDASVRISMGALVAGVVTSGIKIAAGRKRPEDSPHDSHQFDPFSGNDSFPSGHATLAFAVATGLDRETDAVWVPCVAYPVAALVGSSRIRDRKHWLSDVVAGAAIGGWSAVKGGEFAGWWMNRRRGPAVGWNVAPEGGLQMTVATRF
jgi:hypothetical protein